MIENNFIFWLVIYLIWLPLSYILMKNWIKCLSKQWELGDRVVVIFSSLLVFPMFILAIMIGITWIVAMKLSNGWQDDANW
jgi:ABC-type antimicrobial peptide transport system permease subunit